MLIRQRSAGKCSKDHAAWRIKMLLLHSAMLAAPAIFLLLQTNARIPILSGCLIKAITKTDCPACGITHSAVAAYSGNFVESFRIHPAGLAILAILAAMTIYLAAITITQKAIQWKKELRIYTFIDRSMITLLIAGWIGRILIT
jgi:hypothetical protein